MDSRRWLFFSFLVLFAGAGWIWLSQARPGSTTSGEIPAPHAGFTAPDFQLATLDGQTVQLSDLRGQVVLVNVWATWCPPCKAEMPAFQRLYKEYASRGFVILGVNATQQDQLANVRQFVADYGLTFPILLDHESQVLQQYEIRSFPTSFFIDSQGIIQEMVVGGPMSEGALRLRVDRLLGEVR